MNAGMVTTGEAVYWAVREYLRGRNCPWKDSASLTADVKECSGPGKCLFKGHCYVCKFVDSFPEPQKSAISGEIEELRWEIRTNRGEIPLKCPICGVIKTVVSGKQPLCGMCSAHVSPSFPITKETTAMQSIDEVVGLHTCPRLGSL